MGWEYIDLWCGSNDDSEVDTDDVTSKKQKMIVLKYFFVEIVLNDVNLQGKKSLNTHGLPVLNNTGFPFQIFRPLHFQHADFR